MIIHINFSYPEDKYSDFFHRIRNFAEDLERKLYEKQIGQVLNMDTATDEVNVKTHSKRYMGDVLKVIKFCLKQHTLLSISATKYS